MERKNPGNIWLLISFSALLYPIIFIICADTFLRKYPVYSAERNKVFANKYPLFADYLSASYISLLLLFFSLIASIVAINKIDGPKAYFIALPVAIVSGVLFLLTVFSLL